MKLKCTGKKGKRHLSGTFIIPKSHGTASIFDEAGRLYAHPSWASRGLQLRYWQIYLLRQMYCTHPHPSSFFTFPWLLFYFPFLCILEVSSGLPWKLTRAGIYWRWRELFWGNDTFCFMELNGSRVNDMTLMTWKYIQIQQAGAEIMSFISQNR